MREEQTTQVTDPKDLDERSREEHVIDSDYDKHGGFPHFEPAQPGPGFAPFIASMRRLQDLAVSTNPDSDTWDAAAARVAELVALLEPYQVGEGVGPAGRMPSMPGGGHLLMPPFTVSQLDAAGVEAKVQFSRYHVGGNHAVHGGVLPLMFDSVFGMVLYGARWPRSRTGFLHVDYRNVTPIDVPLSVRGWLRETEGRKAFVNSELRDPDDKLLAEANGLMVRLLPGQP